MKSLWANRLFVSAVWATAIGLWTHIPDWLGAGVGLLVAAVVLEGMKR